MRPPGHLSAAIEVLETLDARTRPAGDALKARLQEEVRTLEQEVPFADLTSKHDQQYTGVVLTDDDLYHSHLSVRHSHADVPYLLQQRHWPYQKVYSRQFWAEQEEVLRRLRAL